jgi:putative N6-adenine-specific DNA methylase
MDLFKQERKILITCSKHMSSYLASEVSEAGYEPRVFATGVELSGTLEDCIILNVSLRTASQVLLSLGEFMAGDANDLYKSVVDFPWEDIIPDDGFLSVTSNVVQETIDNNMFVNVKVKDAIVDRIMRNKGRRPDSGPRLTGVVIHTYWRTNSAELFLDTSGETLAKHGYRKIPGQAPMLEALASAAIMATQWDRSSPFVNPMCGSGTLAIEAALLATKRPPGLLRTNYSFMHVIGFDGAFYQRVLHNLRKNIQEGSKPEIIATDHNPRAVANARVNARAAGVEQLIRFSVCDFEETPVPEGSGIVFMNPEYGERLGNEATLVALYSRMGDFFKQKCGGYLGYVFTGNLTLAKKIGLKALRRIEFFSAKIDCRLLEYELYTGTRRHAIDETATDKNPRDNTTSS